jgi:phage-related protein
MVDFVRNVSAFASGSSVTIALLRDSEGVAIVYQNKYHALDEPTLAVCFYQSGSGAEPVRDWLNELPKTARRAIGEDMKTVQFGWPLGMPLVRKMEKGLWEVRSHIHSGIARVLFTVVDEQMVLLHGFVKKSPKTPADDLQVARQRMREVHDD